MQRAVPKWWSNVPNQLGAIEHFGSNQDDIGLGAIDNTYTAGPYLLEPGQVLLMTGRMPACFFANVVLWNRFLQTDDYRYQQLSLNRRQLRLGEDDSYRIAIGPRNPRPTHWDWLDTGGRSFGIIQWRFLLAEGAVEPPQLRVAAIDEVASGGMDMTPPAATPAAAGASSERAPDALVEPAATP